MFYFVAHTLFVDKSLENQVVQHYSLRNRKGNLYWKRKLLQEYIGENELLSNDKSYLRRIAPLPFQLRKHPLCANKAGLAPCG